MYLPCTFGFAGVCPNSSSVKEATKTKVSMDHRRGITKGMIQGASNITVKRRVIDNRLGYTFRTAQL